MHTPLISTGLRNTKLIPPLTNNLTLIQPMLLEICLIPSWFSSQHLPSRCRTRNHLTPQKSSCTPLPLPPCTEANMYYFSMASPKFTASLPQPNPHILHFSMTSLKYIYPTCAFPIHLQPYYQYVIAPHQPAHKLCQTLHVTHIMQPRVETLPLYIFSNYFVYFLQLLESLPPLDNSLLNPQLALNVCTPYPRTVSYIPYSLAWRQTKLIPVLLHLK